MKTLILSFFFLPLPSFAAAELACTSDTGVHFEFSAEAGAASDGAILTVKTKGVLAFDYRAEVSARDDSQPGAVSLTLTTLNPQGLADESSVTGRLEVEMSAAAGAPAAARGPGKLVITQKPAHRPRPILPDEYDLKIAKARSRLPT